MANYSIRNGDELIDENGRLVGVRNPDSSESMFVFSEVNGVTGGIGNFQFGDTVVRMNGGVSSDNFQEYESGAPASSMGGTPWRFFATSESAYPTVQGGALTIPTGETGWNYSQLDAGRQVSRLGASFSLSPFTTSGGSAAFVLWSMPIEDSWPVVPESPFHLVVQPTGYTFGVIENGELDVVKTGAFATSLVADGVAQHTLDAVIDGSNGIVYIVLPDGSVDTITDPRIAATSGTVACWEVYRPLATDTVASFHRTWFSSDGIDVGLAKALSSSDARPVVVHYAPATDVSVSVPTGGMVDVDATNLSATITMPRGVTSLEVELTGYIASASAVGVLWAVFIGSTQCTQFVIKSAYDGLVTYKARIDGLSPSTEYSVKWQHFATSSGASLKLHSPAGYAATMKLTPI